MFGVALATPPEIQRQPVSQNILAGYTTGFGVYSPQIPPPKYQWYRDDQAIAGETSANLKLWNVTPQDCGRYRVLLENEGDATWSDEARLIVSPQPFRPGMIDTAFSAGQVSGDGVHTIARAPDGKLYLGGTLNSITGYNRKGMARLLANGQVDPDFNPSFTHSNPDVEATVSAIVLDDSGRIVVGGVFNRCKGVPCSNIARLLPDGSLDSSFGTGANLPVNTLAIDDSGRLLIGGDFTSFNSTPANRLVRLLANDSPDALFNTRQAYDAAVEDLAPFSGKWYVSGGFTQRIARILDDGSPDPSYSGAFQPSRTVTDLAVLSGGELIAAGEFFDGIIKLDRNGLRDPDFRPRPNDFVYDLATTDSGQILLAGDFTSVDGQSIRGVARLLPNGNLDTTFQPPSFNGPIYTLFPEGPHLYLGGDFNLPHDHLIRLLPKPGAPAPSPPVISCQPESQTVTPGQAVTLAVATNHSSGMSYQWYHQGLPIPEATSSQILLPNIDDSLLGNYHVKVSHGGFTITSDSAILSPHDLPLGLAHSSQYEGGPTPLGDLGTTRVDLEVPISYPVGKVRLALGLTHPKVNDLTITLQSPNGTKTRLFRRNGRRGRDIDTIFDDDGLGLLDDASAPWTGTWKPENPLAPHNGQNARGTWTLQITDRGGGLNPGKINKVILEILEPPAPVTYQAWLDLYNADVEPLIAFAVVNSPTDHLVELEDVYHHEGNLYFSHYRWKEVAGLSYQYQTLFDGYWQPILPRIERCIDLGNNRQYLQLRLEEADPHLLIRLKATQTDL